MHDAVHILHRMWYRRWLYRANLTKNESMVLQVEEQPFHPALAALIIQDYLKSKEYKEKVLQDVTEMANNLIESGHYAPHEFDHKDLTGFAHDVLKLINIYQRRMDYG